MNKVVCCFGCIEKIKIKIKKPRNIVIFRGGLFGEHQNATIYPLWLKQSTRVPLTFGENIINQRKDLGSFSFHEQTFEHHRFSEHF